MFVQMELSPFIIVENDLPKNPASVHSSLTVPNELKLIEPLLPLNEFEVKFEVLALRLFVGIVTFVLRPVLSICPLIVRGFDAKRVPIMSKARI